MNKEKHTNLLHPHEGSPGQVDNWHIFHDRTVTSRIARPYFMW